MLNTEQAEVLGLFMDMLKAPTGDGAVKRAEGTKPCWKDDTTHEAAIFSHLNKWKHGEKRDATSGSHPLVHLAWRALAIAWQESQAESEVAAAPRKWTSLQEVSKQYPPGCPTTRIPTMSTKQDAVADALDYTSSDYSQIMVDNMQAAEQRHLIEMSAKRAANRAKNRVLD